MSNTLQLWRSSGFFACCSLACDDIVTYIKQNKRVPDVDFTDTFKWYRDRGDQNVYPECFSFDGSQNIDIDKYVNYNYRCKSLFDYKLEEMDNVQPLVKRWFTPSKSVMSYVDTFCDKYNIEPENTLGVCYRGTNKHLDIAAPSYEQFVSHVDVLSSKYSRVLVQSDQQQFVDFFRNKFPSVDTIQIQEIPTTTSDKHLYRGGGIKKDKVKHAQMFLAAVQILSRCKYLINHTGNVARWLTYYRGTTDNTIQYITNKCCDNIIES